MSDEAAGASQPGAQTTGEGGGPQLDLDALSRKGQQLRAQTTRVSAELDVIVRQEANDRSMITREVMEKFGYAVLIVFGLLGIEGVMSKDWAEVSKQAVDLLKSVLLPVVTLVLGYYFGRASK